MVLAGGGITPDYIVRYDSMTKLRRDIWNKNLFFEFDAEYLSGNGKNLKSKYKDNFNDYLVNWEPSEQLIQEFKAFIEKKGVEWSKDNYEADKKYINNLIKANFARSIWDRNKYLQIWLSSDNMVNKVQKSPHFHEIEDRITSHLYPHYKVV